MKRINLKMVIKFQLLKVSRPYSKNKKFEVMGEI